MKILTSLKGADREALLAYEGPITRIEKGEFCDTLPNPWQRRNAGSKIRQSPASMGWVPVAMRMRDDGKPVAEIAKAVGKSARRIRTVFNERKKLAAGGS